MKKTYQIWQRLEAECPEGFAFNWLNTLEIRDFIIKSFSSINIRLWNTEYTSQGIRNPSNDWNPESGIQVPLTKNLESSSGNPESMVWKSQAVLGSLFC